MNFGERVRVRGVGQRTLSRNQGRERMTARGWKSRFDRLNSRL